MIRQIMKQFERNMKPIALIKKRYEMNTKRFATISQYMSWKSIFLVNKSTFPSVNLEIVIIIAIVILIAIFIVTLIAIFIVILIMIVIVIQTYSIMYLGVSSDAY